MDDLMGLFAVCVPNRGDNLLHANKVFILLLCLRDIFVAQRIALGRMVVLDLSGHSIYIHGGKTGFLFLDVHNYRQCTFTDFRVHLTDFSP